MRLIVKYFWGINMNNLSFTACSFHFKETNSKGDYRIFALNSKYKFKKISNTIEADSFDILKGFLETRSGYINDENEEKLFSCSFDSMGENEYFRFLMGRIKCGSYGYLSDVVDIDSMKTITKIKPNQAPIKDFLFFIAIPKDNKRVTVEKGLLFFQNYGQFGIKTITLKYLQVYLNQFHITIKCGNIAPKLFVDKVLTKEALNKIILIKNNKSQDLADKNYFGFGQETRILSQLKLNTNIFDKIKGYVSQNQTLFELEGQEYDALKVQVRIGERERVINLNNIENLSIIESLPNDLMDSSGEIDINRAINIFTANAKDYLSEMVLQITQD